MLFLTIIIKLVFGLIGLLIMVRILGKKEMAQITPFDFIYALILGGILEESIYDNNVRIYHVLFSLLVWGILVYIIERYVQKNEKARKLLKGKTTVLVSEGNMLVEAFRENNMELEQFRTMLRGKSIFSSREVEFACLETNGEISVLRADNKPTERSYLLINEGEIEGDELKNIQKNEEWLTNNIKKEGYAEIEDIFCAEWTKNNGFFIVPKRQSKQISME